MRAWLKRLFCRHDWRQHSCDRYSVLDAAERKIAEVTLTLFVCKRCNANKLISSDRECVPTPKETT